jgi:hypothetical protein
MSRPITTRRGRHADGELPPRVGELLPLVWQRIRAMLFDTPPPRKVKRRTRPRKNDKQVTRNIA